MRQNIILASILLVLAFGFSITISRVSDLSLSLQTITSALLPRQIILSPQPLEVQMQPCVTLKKTINGVEISYPCCKKPGETNQEWGARCMQEFQEFCEGYGGS